jgi:shikimate dehydrogenase
MSGDRGASGAHGARSAHGVGDDEGDDERADEGAGAAAALPVRALLLAHPAGHSLSPDMHDAAFAAIGLRGRYGAVDVPPAELGTAVARLRADLSLLGANVTVPHKQAVMAHLDRLAPLAERLGAVNTIRRDGDALVGDNTDAPGFARAITALGRPLRGEVAVVLGAGGAAAAVVAALVDAGARVLVHNRSPERARALAARWSSSGVRALTDGELEAASSDAAWLVNTTTVGMQGGPPGSPIAAEALPRAGAVVDLVYRPRRTPLLDAARARGLPTEDGVAMLVHQGALAFEMWTGRSAPVDVMRAAVEARLPE